MKAVLLDVIHDKVEVVDAEELEDYYKLIGCRTIEIGKSWVEDLILFVMKRDYFLKIRKFHLLMINAM